MHAPGLRLLPTPGELSSYGYASVGSVEEYRREIGPVATRNLINAEAAARSVDAEAGLVAPLYENIHPPESFGPIEVLVDDLRQRGAI